MVIKTTGVNVSPPPSPPCGDPGQRAILFGQWGGGVAGRRSYPAHQSRGRKERGGVLFLVAVVIVVVVLVVVVVGLVLVGLVLLLAVVTVVVVVVFVFVVVVIVGLVLEEFAFHTTSALYHLDLPPIRFLGRHCDPIPLRLPMLFRSK